MSGLRDDWIMTWRHHCTSELDYTEQSSWLLFLKYLDSLEHDNLPAREGGSAGNHLGAPELAEGRLL